MGDLRRQLVDHRCSRHVHTSREHENNTERGQETFLCRKVIPYCTTSATGRLNTCIRSRWDPHTTAFPTKVLPVPLSLSRSLTSLGSAHAWRESIPCHTDLRCSRNALYKIDTAGLTCQLDVGTRARCCTALTSWDLAVRRGCLHDDG